MAKIGTLIDGKYEVLREIGRGGMSVVYLAMDTRLNKQWAIKEIARKANDANNEIVVSSLLAEANLMKKLDHPSLPRIVDIIEEHDTIYVVMDYIEGEPLSKILELYGAQDQDLVIEWGKQLCDVLFYLHNCEPPIIYRDMKPANVMLRPDGTVKLIDFGIAREYKRSKTADTESLGTRGYAAPEQFGGKGQTDARTDIYCFGVTLYHLVTGLNPCEPPYELYPIKQVNPNFYDGLQYLIQKCTQMNPEDRFQSCDEIRYVLDNIQEFDKGRRIRQKKKFNAFIVMTVMTIVFAILGSGMLFGANQALQKSLSQNIENLGNATSYSQLEDAYNNIITEGNGFDDDDKLKFLATYMEKVYKFRDDIDQGLQDINIIDYVQDDIIPLDEAADGNIYADLSSEQRTNLAKFCYYQGKFYFNSDMNFTEAKSSLSLLFEDGLDLLSGKYSYDDSENGMTNKDLEDAQSYYYCSVIYTYLNAQDSASSNPLNHDSEENELDIVECFEQIVKSIELTDSTSDEGTRRSMYVSYYSMLEKQNRIKSYKDDGISKDDVAKIYKSLYGEDYMSVRAKALDLSTDGTIAGLTKDQIATFPYDATKGIFGVSWPENSNFDTMKNNRVIIADYIYQVYGG